MADGVRFKIEGLALLKGKLREVSIDLRRKSGRAALRKAANVIADRARVNAARLDDPETGRSIASNVAVRWNGKLFKRTGNLGFRVGVQHGAALKKRPDKGVNAPTPHWRLLEFGTEKMRAQPFMRPAVDSSAQQVAATFVTSYEKGIERAIARAKKKGEDP